MELFKLTTPKDDAWSVVEKLGRQDLVQFLNVNPITEITKLLYQERIKICEETERRILFLINTCKENHIKINRPPNSEAFRKNIESIETSKMKSRDLLFDAIEQEVRDCESFVAAQRETIDEIKSNIAKLEDYHEVIQFISEMTHSLGGARPAQADARDAENPANEPLMDSTLQFISGTINRKDQEQMGKMLFRITRGKALTHFKIFNQDEVEKVAYLVVFSAGGGNRERVQKICDSFMGQRFEIPDMTGLDEVLFEIKTKITKSKDLYNTSNGQLKDYLFEMNQSSSRAKEQSTDLISTLEIYKWFVAKEKAIYNALNLFKLHKQTFIAFMWIPAEKEAIVSESLTEFGTTEFAKWRDPSGGEGPIKPTSYKSNDMLAFHQVCVDTYKTATYGEINPAIFQIVTFPFLFGVMYGDYGHGAIFFLLGCVLCLFEPKLRKNPDMEGLLMTRYFWLMMGFFSIYQGMIYNEFFAISNDWFGTCYDVASFVPGDATKADITYKDGNQDCAYVFGMDPTQTLSASYLTFTNNIKEKLAVIIAYFHLNFGIVLNGLNCIYFGKWQKLTFDVITGLLIFAGLIGYMIVLIYVKWWFAVDPYAPVNSPLTPGELNISTSPSIISLIIGDIMGVIGLSTPNDPDFFYFSSQQDVSNILLLITAICLPTMLCAIPCIQICCGGKHHAEADVPDNFTGVQAIKHEEEKGLMGDDDLHDGQIDIMEMLKSHSPKESGDHGVGETFIHQIIETIEFVLGCISNTASYLRLWALSLAHGQLGEVFLTLIFTQLGLDVASLSTFVAALYFFIFAFAYMAAVFAVLMMMDLLEVFLHTMRLHWVEFMGKFFEGAGIPYRPFSFTEVFDRERSRKDTVQ